MPASHRYLINNAAGDLLAVASAALEAEIAASRGDAKASVAAWRRAAQREARLDYDEPPPWYEPVAERLGAALLRAGRAAEAEQVFRDCLATRPRDGRVLYGLWQSLLAQQREGDAALVEQRYRTAWQDADAELRLEDL